MPEQSYEKHAKFVPAYHYFLSALILAILIGSCVNIYQSWGDHTRIYSATLITAIAVALAVFFVFARAFPLQAQDRAIRAEENMRHFTMTGRPLDPRLTIKQIVGLRFASDAEFVALANRAAAEGMSPKDIKKSVKNWRADHDRL